ncbi:hypothetical protein SLA2020_041340 [Shorea laevis]
MTLFSSAFSPHCLPWKHCHSGAAIRLLEFLGLVATDNVGLLKKSNFGYDLVIGGYIGTGMKKKLSNPDLVPLTPPPSSTLASCQNPNLVPCF